MSIEHQLPESSEVSYTCFMSILEMSLATQVCTCPDEHVRVQLTLCFAREEAHSCHAQHLSLPSRYPLDERIDEIRLM